MINSNTSLLGHRFKCLICSKIQYTKYNTVMSDLETRYNIVIKDNQFIKYRRFFIQGSYTPDLKQDIHVYKHTEEPDCFVVYKSLMTVLYFVY